METLLLVLDLVGTNQTLRVLGESFRDWIMPRERSGGMVGGRPAGQGQARNGRPAAEDAPSAVR